jgi:hypothetical protein
LIPEPGIRQGGACHLVDLEAALDRVIADEALFRVVGLGECDRRAGCAQRVAPL